MTGSLRRSKRATAEAYCFTCLGTALESSPNKLREAAQILVLGVSFAPRTATASIAHDLTT
jgi:hypothetical protein